MAWGALMGIVFGAIMNLWSWPFIASGTSLPDAQTWVPGAGLGEALNRYTAFYLATSLPWDIWMSLGNALLIAVPRSPDPPPLEPLQAALLL